MKALALVLALASAASAHPQLELVRPARPVSPAEAAAQAGQPYWFKTYSTAPYSEMWTGALALKKYDRDLLKVVAAIKANGGALTQPLKNFVSDPKAKIQQMTFTVPRKNTKALLKALRRLGDMKEPSVQVTGAPIPLAEVRAKIAVMMKEKTEHGAELAKVPAAAAAEEEILEHLLMVEEVGARSVVEVRFNLTASQK